MQFSHFCNQKTVVVFYSWELTLFWWTVRHHKMYIQYHKITFFYLKIMLMHNIFPYSSIAQFYYPMNEWINVTNFKRISFRCLFSKFQNQYAAKSHTYNYVEKTVAFKNVLHCEWNHAACFLLNYMYRFSSNIIHSKYNTFNNNLI